MKKKKKVILGIAIFVVILIIISIIILNKTNVVERIGASINGSNAGSEEELEDEENTENGGKNLLDETSEDESVVELDIEDGYYDEENKVTWHVEEDGSMCPIPDGYVGSEATGEDEINTGYVIYEGEKEVTDENVAEAKTSRNQYVWIPVPDASQMYGTDSNGKKWGKLYYFATSSNNANYDEETGTYPNNWSESNGVMSLSSSTSYREPDVVKSYDTDSRLITLGLGAKTTHEFLIQLDQEFNAMIESVEKYGGFYIGRYETGNLNQETSVVVQGNTNIGGKTWYTMYSKCKTLSGDNENVVTGMIWGCQWDRTLIWLVESENKTVAEITDSRTWGNYIDSTGDAATDSGSIRSTGYSKYWKAANIYDLAGNVFEWTAESYYDSIRVWRGGGYDSSGFSYPAVYRLDYFSYPLYGNNNRRLQGSTLY